MPDMVEVVIDSIRMSLMSQQRMVILRQAGAERYLPIWIGVYEAEAITLALQEVEVARPLTWDLLKNVFNSLNARVARVEVVALKDDVFYANIVVESEDGFVNIDSRPSDALALAVRIHVPIMVTTAIMNSAGITPDEDLQEKPALKAEKVADSGEEASEERLSVFEDFLGKLDLDKLGGKEEEDDQKDDQADDQKK